MYSRVEEKYRVVRKNSSTFFWRNFVKHFDRFPKFIHWHSQLLIYEIMKFTTKSQTNRYQSVDGKLEKLPFVCMCINIWPEIIRTLSNGPKFSASLFHKVLQRNVWVSEVSWKSLFHHFAGVSKICRYLLKLPQKNVVVYFLDHVYLYP